VFDWLGHRGSGWWKSLGDMRILDAFAGCGALGFEAASRGASEVHLLENHPRALASLRHAKALLDATQVRVHAADALQFMDEVAAGGDRFDLVFLDPPFASDLIFPALERAARCLALHGLVYLEAARSWEDLHPKQVHTNFSVLRQARAGAVHYHLLQHRA
jgi:16S rRNA (guanine(966)-N(2))-methyltransferase RsmD